MQYVKRKQKKGGGEKMLEYVICQKNEAKVLTKKHDQSKKKGFSQPLKVPGCETPLQSDISEEFLFFFPRTPWGKRKTLPQK